MIKYKRVKFHISLDLPQVYRHFTTSIFERRITILIFHKYINVSIFYKYRNIEIFYILDKYINIRNKYISILQVYEYINIRNKYINII